MKIEDIIEERKIEDIIHYTTNSGLTGILASGHLLSRARLKVDQYLEHIIYYNCESRIRDKEWLDYINLSITTANMNLFGISRGKWHSEMEGWWCLLSFSPEILLHLGVFFTTTNNIYTSVKREPGPQGLNNLFADRIERWSGNVEMRKSHLPSNQPTCNQAEVLYPVELSIEYLRHIYVEGEENQDAVGNIIAAFKGLPKFDCLVRPELF